MVSMVLCYEAVEDTNIQQESILHPHRDAEVVELLAAEGSEDLLAELVCPFVQERELAGTGPI
jgi:hypothetical protein